MEWLNYHHLFYFWAVAKDGSIVRASERLNLAQPTISGQLRALEETIGEKLFNRVGRNLVLTDVGRMVYRYADEIFTLGRELMDTLHDRPTGRPLRMAAGITDVLPKLVAYRLLAPALQGPLPVHMVCHEGKLEHLLTELALYNLDVVLSDTPLSTQFHVKAFNHLLGECHVGFFAAPSLATCYRVNFPRSLDAAPLLMPTAHTTLRRSLDHWLESEGIRPQIVGEFDDSALLNVFGQRGIGIFAAPVVITAEILQQYGVEVIGEATAVRERFYAITVERKLKHPAIVAICDAARQTLFS